MIVHIEEIKDYDLNRIIAFVQKVAQREGLWSKLETMQVKKILLKPNLLGPHIPEKAVTTHPIVVEAMITILQERGFEVFIGDSPGGNIDISNLWDVTGMKALADKYGIKLLRFGEKGVVKLSSGEFELVLDKQVIDFQAIFNLCKYKTHSLTLVTGAVKNLFGVVPGLTKSDYHRLYPQPNKLAELIVKIYVELRDKLILNIMDGIIGMEGEGPSSGSPRNFGLMLASVSGSALDYTAARMLGYQAELIPTVKMSLAVDAVKPEEIIVPDRWKSFVFKNTKIGKPSISSAFINAMPRFIQKIFFRVFDYYPAFNSNCTLCLVCMNGCPVEAISLIDSSSQAAERKLLIDRKKCIKCMCCQEFCQYKAINLKKTFLARLILR